MLSSNLKIKSKSLGNKSMPELTGFKHLKTCELTSKCSTRKTSFTSFSTALKRNRSADRLTNKPSRNAHPINETRNRAAAKFSLFADSLQSSWKAPLDSERVTPATARSVDQRSRQESSSSTSALKILNPFTHVRSLIHHPRGPAAKIPTQAQQILSAEMDSSASPLPPWWPTSPPPSDPLHPISSMAPSSSALPSPLSPSPSPSRFLRSFASFVKPSSAGPGHAIALDGSEAPLSEHLQELWRRVLTAAAATGVSVSGCLLFAREITTLLEAPAAARGVRFLQLAPTEYFFTTMKVASCVGLLAAAPVALAQAAAFVDPGLTEDERRMLAPLVLGSSVLFYAGVLFSFQCLAPAALGFFISYAAGGAVESLWSVDQYFDFIISLMFGTGLAFQLPVLQVTLGSLGVVTSSQMLSAWRHVVVAATVVAAVLTPSTDALTQALLAAPMVALYLGGTAVVRLIERSRTRMSSSSAEEEGGVAVAARGLSARGLSAGSLSEGLAAAAGGMAAAPSAAWADGKGSRWAERLRSLTRAE